MVLSHLVFTLLSTKVNETGCDTYSKAASEFASDWQHYAYEATPAPHYKIAYNYTNSYSVKVCVGDRNRETCRDRCRPVYQSVSLF